MFSNPQFEIRTTIINNEPWFVGKDVAERLGYADTAQAVRQHIDEEDKGVVNLTTPGGNQNVTIINESGLYSLVLRSNLPTAGTADNPLFCLADVCKVLELQPSAVIRRLDDGVICSHPIQDSLGRTQRANFVKARLTEGLSQIEVIDTIGLKKDGVVLTEVTDLKKEKNALKNADFAAYFCFAKC